MAPSDYSHKPGGSLKLKGNPTKKKKKSTTSQRLRQEDGINSARGGSGSDGVEGGEGREGSYQSERENEVGRSESPSISKTDASTSGKTAAQIRFEDVQRKRLLEKAAKAATKTHKERVAEFNEKLENLSEHYDIPKVGPG